MRVLRFCGYVLLALVMPCAENTLLSQQGAPPVMKSARTWNTVKLDLTLPWVSEYRPPFIYQVWWAELAGCEGLPLPMDSVRKVQYFQVNGPDFIPDDEQSIDFAVTYDVGQTFVAEPYIWNRALIKHEALHLLLMWAGDPKWFHHDPQFFDRCGVVSSGVPPEND